MKFDLKTWRTSKGLTVKEAANKLEISEYTLMNYESGKTFPSVPVIKRMEKLYNTTYDNILFLP